MAQRAGLSEGEVFAGYTIIRPLGAGGMGQVYLGQHPRLPRRDALKMLPTDVSVNLEFRQRFNREAELAASLFHEHIVGIHDRGEYEGQLWISMDYVEGTDAARLLSSQFPSGMPRSDVVEIISAVAEALDHAHSRGLLHRDIKPANILLGDANPRRRILLANTVCESAQQPTGSRGPDRGADHHRAGRGGRGRRSPDARLPPPSTGQQHASCVSATVERLRRAPSTTG